MHQFQMIKKRPQVIHNNNNHHDYSSNNKKVNLNPWNNLNKSRSKEINNPFRIATQ